MDRIRTNRRFGALTFMLSGTALLLAGCTTYDAAPITIPLEIAKAADQSDDIGGRLGNDPSSGRDNLTSSQGPAIPTARNTGGSFISSDAPKLEGEPISVNFEGIRLPAFINTVFGELLQVSFDIANGVTQKTDIMVTMRTAESLEPDEFYQLIVETLQFYGVSVVYSNNVYRIVDTTTAKDPVPRIIRTRAISSIPADMRPLFYFEPLDNISTATMNIWLDLALRGRVQAVAVPNANGLLILGEREDVAAALDIIDVLDQPYMAGYQSLRIAPAFWSAQNLAGQLVEILSAEGYSIAVGGRGQDAIKLVPVEALNIIIAFGTGRDALQHVLQWAAELDQPSQTIADKGVYYQQIYNAKAEDLADIISGFIDDTSTTQDDGSSSGFVSEKIRVDEARNALIFVGSAEEYAQFRTLISQMDRAPLEVMIEATIAEVTLSQGEDLGVVFNFNDSAANASDSTSIISDAEGIFFNLVRDRGSLVSQVNALANTDRVQILSSPRLVTSSGKAATINVGTQVPLITTQQTDPNSSVGGTSSILQSIQYRSTGVTLNVEPTINSNRRVELTVSQDVSEAQANNLSGVQSPIILTRAISTTLSLTDGETVLLGGLIQENYSDGDSGVPYLKDIPFLGNLFKTQSKALDRTELIILLTPYIIDSPETSRQVRDAFRERLGEWANPIGETGDNMENIQ